MLPVAVHLDHVVVAVVERVDEARLNRAADPEIEGMADDPRAGVLSEGPGAVGRAVVDDDDVEPGRPLLDRANDTADRRRLVVGRNDGEV